MFLFAFALKMQSQIKTDTVAFTLHCLENEVEVEENLLDQMDSILGKLGFFDLEYNTRVLQAVVFGHTDNKGSKKSNQILSENRANYVYNNFRSHSSLIKNDIVLGFGETKPLNNNKTPEQRAENRRVEVTIIYTQYKLEKSTKKPEIFADTIIVFEDGTKLKMNVRDYHAIKNCLKYERNTSLFDLFEDLAANDNDETYYNFGKVSISWCGTPCLDNKITLSIKVPDSLLKASLKELKVYVKQLKNQQAKLVKHKDNMWYIDAVSYCPFWVPGCGFHCRTTSEKPKYKKVKYVAKNGYRIVGAFINQGQIFSYKKMNIAKRKIKFKVTCPSTLPIVSIVAVNKNNLDTIYYASGTEQTISYKRRCFNCIDKDTVVRKIVGIKIHKRLLRRKYIFKPMDYKHKLARKITNGKK